jgi:hypothetical protein
MPRQARIDAPGALHHIIVRGIERKKIFRDDKDRNDFLENIGAISKEIGGEGVGVSATALGEGLGRTEPAVSISVKRGGKIAAEMGLQSGNIL